MVNAENPSGDEAELARLLEQFHDARRSEPSAGIGALHKEAGRLFDRLVGIADCERLLRAVVSDEEEQPLVEFAGHRILEQIGQGAAGVVYRAVAPDGRTVALKVMKPTLFASGEALVRFAQEARTAGRLDHPHIARVFDSGEVEGRMYIAMELLSGRSLADLLKYIRSACRRRPDEGWLKVLDEAGVPKAGGSGGRSGATYARRLAKALAPVADALGALARQGIVHRDIKPGNLVFDGEGNLKVTDFGLAKVFGETITSTMAVLGTPAYMSPEQARGESRKVDHRTDVYSLGATLYEALTLDLPVSGSTFGEALAAIQRERPRPIASFCAEYEGSLSVLVDRCLEKDARDRYQKPEELARDLAQFADTSSVSAKPVSAARRFQRLVGRNPGAAATIGGTLGIAVIAALFLALRPASVEITSIPAGQVAIDGQAPVTTPWRGSLASGRHEVVVSRDRFKPRRVEFDLSPGQRFAETYPLWPADESDPVALDLLKKAWGFKVSLPTGDPVVARALPPGKPWHLAAALVSPNGRVTRAGLTVALRLEQPPPGLVVRVTDAYDQVLFEHALEGDADLPIPAEAIPHGEPCRIVVSREGGSGTLAADFTLVDEPDLGSRLGAFPPEVRGEPSVRILAAGQLLEAQLSSEAFLASEGLAAEGELMPLRLALMALAQMGFYDRKVYLDLHRRYEEVKASGR